VRVLAGDDEGNEGEEEPRKLDGEARADRVIVDEVRGIGDGTGSELGVRDVLVREDGDPEMMDRNSKTKTSNAQRRPSLWWRARLLNQVGME